MKKIVQITFIALFFISCKEDRSYLSGLYSSIFSYSKVDSCKFVCNYETGTNDFSKNYWPIYGWAYEHYFFRPNQLLIDSVCLSKKCDSIACNMALTDLLINDKRFNDFFVPFYKRCLNKDTTDIRWDIAIDSLVNLISYFYYAKRWSRDNSIVYSVCMARNPFEHVAEVTPEILELGGFCSLVIMKSELLWEPFAKYRDIVDKEVKDLKVLEKDIIDYKSNRIQTLMRNDPVFKSEIISFYNKNRNILSFSLKY